MLQRSAITKKSKVSTAVAKYRRRWKNILRLLPKEEFQCVTSEYSDELAAMGYSESWREEAIKSCLAGYEKIIHSGQPINRSGASSMWSRRAKKLVGAKNWFQDKVRDNKT